ncbi:MAG: N-acetylmuramoyl-L-alanine amidase [Oscillospiraceae bacterium]|nr:N-acetylmuramoyl-L-alanine amidase [Oscillospiraceae bacterium]
MKKKTMSFIAAALLTLALAVSPAVFAKAAEGELQGKTIILDAGHGVGNSNVYADYDEGKAMLALALKIKAVLEKNGATVQMTRPDEKNVSVYVRAAKVNIWALQAVKNIRRGEAGEIDRLIGVMQAIIKDPEENAAIYMNYPFDYDFERKIHPDLKKVFEYENHAAVRDNFLMISLHSNATGTPIKTSVSGADAFYMSNSHDWMKNYYTKYSYEKQSLNFAGKILSAIDKLGIQKRKAEAACYVVIREHNVPAVLIENGFHTNDADRAKLSDDKFLDKLAQAYADAVISYFSEIIPEKIVPELPERPERPEIPEETPKPDQSQTAQVRYLSAKNVKLSLNRHSVNLTENPIFVSGELYFGIEDIARISGYASDSAGFLYRGEAYELKKPFVSEGKLFISAGELLSIQRSVLWAEVKIELTNDVRVRFAANKYTPRWDGGAPEFINGELCVPLGPVLRILGYTAQLEDALLTIYRNDSPVHSTETGYMIISDALYMTAGQLNEIKGILWASFDFNLIF